MMSASSNAVQWNIVKSKVWGAKFNLLTDDIVVNALVRSEAFRVLWHRNNTDFEDMSIVSRTSRTVIGRSTNALQAGQVRYTEDLKQGIASAQGRGEKLIALHNHPNGRPPSFEDVVSMFGRNYSKSIVVGHDGSLYVIDAISPGFAPYHYRELFVGFLGSGKDDAASAILTLEKLKSMRLISWRRL
jgi:hypothetical protein